MTLDKQQNEMIFWKKHNTTTSEAQNHNSVVSTQIPEIPKTHRYGKKTLNLLDRGLY